MKSSLCCYLWDSTFGFQQVDYNVSQWGSWGLLRFLNMYIHVLHQIWKVFGHYSNIFFCSFLCAFFLGLPLYICWYIWCYTTGLLGSVHCCLVFSFCSLDWEISIDLFSSLLILSPGCSNILFIFSWIFHFSNYTFQLLYLCIDLGVDLFLLTHHFHDFL